MVSASRESVLGVRTSTAEQTLGQDCDLEHAERSRESKATHPFAEGLRHWV